MLNSDIKKLKRISRDIINCDSIAEKNKLLDKINNI